MKLRLPIFILLLFTACSSLPRPNRKSNADNVVQLKMTKAEAKARMPFVSHAGPGSFDNALALNVAYEPIRSLRAPIETLIGRQLDYLKTWGPDGEAHVTIITPPEFAGVLGKRLTMPEIEAIASKHEIQKSDLEFLGIGSGRKEIGGKTEETFFVIVISSRLSLIRVKIWEEYVRKGGNPADWDPTWFFPHITIGYTKTDIHEPDVMKNIRGSWNPQLRLIIK